jgi:uncharacterized protein YjbI with pentapeptide repeats
MPAEYYQESFRSTAILTSAGTGDLFESCEFIGLRPTPGERLRLTGLRFEDCTFRDCDFTGATLGETAFQDCTFEECKLSGLRWDEVRALNFACSFLRSNLSFSVFAGRDLTRCKFKDCKLEEADLERAVCDGLAFDGCQLSGAQWSGASCLKSDFRASQGLTFDPNRVRLKGALFTTEGLRGLVAHHGITVD